MARIPGDSLIEIRQKMPKGMFDAQRAMARAMWEEGTLDTTLRELLRLKTAELAGCVH